MNVLGMELGLSGLAASALTTLRPLDGPLKGFHSWQDLVAVKVPSLGSGSWVFLGAIENSLGIPLACQSF